MLVSFTLMRDGEEYQGRGEGWGGDHELVFCIISLEVPLKHSQKDAKEIVR